MSSLLGDGVRCSICLNVLTKPVTTPCGHECCETCLSKHLDTVGLCHCPVCNKSFQVRPETSATTAVDESPVQLKKRKVATPAGDCGPWDIECDVCMETKVKALKSCLTCLTSYCEAHLEPHLRVPSLVKHKLSDPVEDLEERTCFKHHRLLELFCREDNLCICLLCSETDHKCHETVLVEEEWALQRDTVESRKAKVKTLIQDRNEKIQEFTRHSEVSREKTEKEIKESQTLFTTLMSHVRDTQEKLKQNIELKLWKSQDKDKAMIEELHYEIEQLQRKLSELEDLSQYEDPLQLLQCLQALDAISVTKKWSRLSVYSDLCVQTVRRALTHLVYMFDTELKTLTKAELTRTREYTESVTFDPETAGCCLVVTENGKRLKYFRDASPSGLKNPKAFTLPRILGTVGFTSGRHYWEVQVGLKTDWDVGVAVKTVSRTQKTTLTKENGCFAIRKRGAEYRVNTTSGMVLHLSPRPTHVGVYLDYNEGRLSFYDIDRNLHIFSFVGETFSGRIFPYFYLSSWSKKPKPLLIMS